MRYVLSIIVIGTATAWALGQNSSIVNSPHNLSAAGTSTVRASSEQQICIFCHTPHNARAIQPLWNRNDPVSPYTVYSSPSLKAQVGQPTGSSKLCLSCHDGTIAIGSVVSRGQPIAMAGGITTLPPGKTNLGTDLSDDHPVSFLYNQTLATQRPTLKSPLLLPPTVKLDKRQEMQCTTCHDAHNNTNGNFLVMNNSNSQLCNTCHQPGITNIPHHQECSACHAPHSAPSRAYLLKGINVTETCLKCHSGTPGAPLGPNIATDLAKFTRHDARVSTSEPNHLPNYVVCSDCHEGHTMTSGTASAPLLSPQLGHIDGISDAGAIMPQAKYQYEVCFKCHSTPVAKTGGITRQVVQTNTRMKFSPTAFSYHPVEAAGRTTTVPSLIAPLTTASMIYCTDCHASDTGKAANGTGPNGPHGSSNQAMLLARYDTTDYSGTTDTTAYALCYRCHSRTTLMSDKSNFPFHEKHVRGVQAPCSTCHDPHGVAAPGNATNNSHLINFDTTIVKPNSSGRLNYQRIAVNQGQCFLKCHNVNHNPEGYGGSGGRSRLRIPRK